MTDPAELTFPDLTFAGGGGPQAGPMTTLVTGAVVSPGISPVLIALPGSGQLQICYEYQDRPAKTAILWHQGGSFQPLIPGCQTYNSRCPETALILEMAYAGQSVKVGWAYL